MEEGTPTGYSMTALMRLNPGYLLGDIEHPGPLVTLAYPDVLRMREVSRDAKKITDMDYFWELKTRRDFGAENKYPQRRNWKEEYLSYGEKLVPELVKASQEGNGSKVRELLDLGVNPNMKNDEGNTALILASENGHSETVRELLNRGADIDVQGDRGTTALISASGKGHSETVRALLNRGADPDVKNIDGYTALITASVVKRVEITRELLRGGADPNLQDIYGKTALFYAKIIGGGKEIVELLENAIRTPASLANLSRRSLRGAKRDIPEYLQ